MRCNLKSHCPGMRPVTVYTLSMKMKLIIAQKTRNFFGGADWLLASQETLRCVDVFMPAYSSECLGKKMRHTTFLHVDT